MAKSKYAPALFEMINKRQDAKDGGKLSVPKWWRRGSDEPAAEPDSAETVEEEFVARDIDESVMAPAPEAGEAHTPTPTVVLPALAAPVPVAVRELAPRPVSPGTS